MCAGCSKKTLEYAEALKAKEAPSVVPAPRLSMQCIGCGMTRLLPTGLNPQDIFELVPCPKCNKGFRGRFVGNGVEEIIG